jgi:hypothetical protein
MLCWYYSHRVCTLVQMKMIMTIKIKVGSQELLATKDTQPVPDQLSIKTQVKSLRISRPYLFRSLSRLRRLKRKINCTHC